MPLYTITATKETFYEVPIEADSEAEALDIFNAYELQNDFNRFEVDSFPLEITDIDVEEELA
jgi:hypothetical protein